MGLPGSGKSYFAKRLAKRLKGKHQSSDRLRKFLFPTPTYSPEEKLDVYQEMTARAAFDVFSGKIAVIDSTFYLKDIRDLVINRISELGIRYAIIHIKADEDLIKERTSQKRPDSDADFAVYLKLKELSEPLEEPHLVLTSTNENIDEMLEKALNYLAWQDD